MIFLAPAAWSSDVVYLSAEGNPQGHTRIVGEVLSFTTQGVSLRLGGGTIREYPRRVLRIETGLLPEHRLANQAYREGRFAEALTAYLTAVRKETRPWVAEQISAQIIWCHRYLGQHAEAVREFLTLLGGHPQTPFLTAMPLAWFPGEPAPLLEQICVAGLKEVHPAAQLAAASYLLGGPQEHQAEQVLTRLAGASAEPFRTLAFFQLARRRLYQVTVDELLRWEAVATKLPPEFRPGPYAVLAQGWEIKGDPERAARWWLRIAVCHPQHRDLAARALLSAARSLERLSQGEQARALYGELIRTYPESPERTSAESRLGGLSPKR
jgi:tetratricopeptide (TPR) repeat protein